MNTTFNLELNNKPDREGLNEVFLRVTQNRKHKRIKLGLSVKKPDFNKKAKFGAWIRQSNPEYSSLNKQLESKFIEAKENFYEMEKKKQSLSLHSIKEKIENPNPSYSFFLYAKERLKYYTNYPAKYSYSFLKHFNSIIFNKLKSYSESLGMNDLLFSDITVEFLKEYESFLSKADPEKKKKANKKTTIHKNMGFIKALFNEAIADDKMPIKPQDSPFLSYRIEKNKVFKDKLTQEEIKKIEELQLSEGSLIFHSRNMFLFSFYQAGIRASDCIKMKWKNVVNQRLVYYMDKTDNPVNLKLLPKAEGILKQYRKPNSKPNDFIFPLLDSRKDYSDRIVLFNQVASKNTQINTNLRKIATLLEIDKKLSFHIARHSFASIAKNDKKLSTEMISELLNHSSLSTTKAYLKGFENADMDNSLESVTG